ncbi:MAG: conjugal transfer protein TraG N-terminal domain-containing protein [Sulfuricellaceae bacterium]
MKSTKFLAALLALLLLSPGFSLAISNTEVWEIYSYWSVDELWVIFNSISVMMKSAGFANLSKTVMLLVLGATLAATMAYMKDYTVKWLISAMVAFCFFNLPIATVAIVDKTSMQPPKIVADVPVFLAATAALVTQGSDFFTRSFESSYATLFDINHIATKAQLDSLTFRDHDLGFGHRLIKDSRRMRIADPILQADMIYFTRDCINAGMAEGKLDFKRIFQGNTPADTWSYIVANVNPARMTTYHDQWQNLQIGYCDEVANGTLHVDPLDGLTYRLDQGILAATKFYGQKYNRADVTGALFATNLQNAYGVLLKASMNASDVIKQNMFLNLYNDSKGAIGQMMGDPAAVTAAYARAQAAATANSSYQTMGNLAEQAMPLIRNIMENIIYTVYPLLVLIILANAHNAIPIMKTYFMTMVWINLWPPLYAVLNLSAHIRLANKLMADTALSGGLSLQTMGMISSDVISQQSIMGYMVIAIPGIAYGITKGGEVAMNGIMQNFMSPMQNASQGASGAATGNMNQGNLSMDNVGLNKVDMSSSWAGSNRYNSTDSYGNVHGFGLGNDHHSVKQNLSSLAVKPDFTSAINKQLGVEQAKHATEAESYATKGASTIASATSEAWNSISTHVKGTDSSTNHKYGDQLTTEEKMSRVKGFTEEFAEANSVKSSDAFSAGLAASAGIPFKVFKANADASGRITAMDETKYDELRKAMDKAEISDVAGVTATWARDRGISVKDSDSVSGSVNLGAKIDRGLSYMSEASKQYGLSEDIASKIAFNTSNKDGINANLTQVLANELKGKVGGGGESDIANQWAKAEVIADRFAKNHIGMRGNPDVFPDANQMIVTPESLAARKELFERQAKEQGGNPLLPSSAKEGENGANIDWIRADLDGKNIRPNGATSSTHSKMAENIDDKLEHPAETIREQQAKSAANSSLPPSSITADMRNVQRDVETQQKRHEGVGGTAQVVFDKVEKAKVELKPLDTTPKMYGGNNNLLNDKNYDPAQVARNPLGFFNPDQVKQAQDEMKSPQYQKQNVPKDVVINDTPKTLNPDQVRQADQQDQARQVKEELKSLHQKQYQQDQAKQATETLKNWWKKS